MYHLASSLVAVFAPLSGLGVRAQTVTTLSYDTHYDDATLSLNDVACSNGPNGLESKNPNYTTLGSLPTFPNVGGVYTVSGYDSPQCGACYAVTYGSNTINILAVDKATTGFMVSEEAMNNLTGGLATELGRVDVTYVQVPSSQCGMES